MSRGMYRRLAVTNIKKNRKFYLPYLLMGMFMVAMYYIMCALCGNEGLQTMRSGKNVILILEVGTVVVGLFAIIFIFYTNSFIIKRRKKELGLYNILGMEKKHIFKMLFFETLIAAGVCIVGGLVIGVVFNKLLCMFLYQLMDADAGIGFYVSTSGLCNALVLFLVIYLLTLLYNMVQIRLANPIELLHGGNVGEREPKTKILLTIVGLLSLGGGYYIALTTENPLTAILLFFVAVVLVIIGTYSLFTAGSITFLKLLRKNKNYYYKTKHFSAVSFLMYRMKQNAVGLANICILSTAVLIMLSATVCLYVGTQEVVEETYPYDINVTAAYDNPNTDAADLKAVVEKCAKDNGRKVLATEDYVDLYVAATWENEGIVFDEAFGATTEFGQVAMCWIITKETCEEKYDIKLPKLSENEIVLSSSDTEEREKFSIGGENFTVKENRQLISGNSMEEMAGRVVYIIVKDETIMEKIFQMQKAGYKEKASNYNYNLNLNIDGSKEEKLAFGDTVNTVVDEWKKAQPAESLVVDAYSMSRQEYEIFYQGMNGGFLFLGMFLGIMFLMITVLIIFYKQISEGYEDRERFIIMKKVGMSDVEVKATIHSQIRTVFFFPLATAAVHAMVAYPLLKRLLLLFGLTNSELFFVCMLGVIVVFALIYFLVFYITSRTYYRIVGEK